MSEMAVGEKWRPNCSMGVARPEFEPLEVLNDPEFIRFDNKLDFQAEIEDLGACDEGLEFVLGCNSFQEILVEASHAHRFWCLYNGFVQFAEILANPEHSSRGIRYYFGLSFWEWIDEHDISTLIRYKPALFLLGYVPEAVIRKLSALEWTTLLCYFPEKNRPALHKIWEVYGPHIEKRLFRHFKARDRLPNNFLELNEKKRTDAAETGQSSE